MFPLTDIGRIAWLALAIVVTIALVYAKGRADGAAKVEAEWSEQRLTAAFAVQQQTERARLAERTAAQDITKTRERADAQIAALDRRRRAE